MDVVIVGAGGHGKVVLDILYAAGKVRPVGFVDADPTLAGTEVAGLPVFGAVNSLGKLRQQKVKGAVVAIGDNRTRLGYAGTVLEYGLELVSAIHPAAVVSPRAVVGRNVVVAAGAVVGTDARLGDSVIINTSAVVDHECEVGEGSHVCPGALLAGRVRVGKQAFIGMGAKIIQCVSIGEGAVVGAGAVVLRDVPAGVTVVGVPANAIRRPE